MNIKLVVILDVPLDVVEATFELICGADAAIVFVLVGVAVELLLNVVSLGSRVAVRDEKKAIEDVKVAVDDDATVIISVAVTEYTAVASAV